MPTLGDVLAGRYRIDARLGAGGMATVWRAHDLRLDRDVAVKVLLPNLATDPAFAARFDREARTLAAVGDPHVVAVHDVVEAPPAEEPFIVMELCPDGSLGDLLADGPALTPDAALPVLADAAAGLAALHAHGIVHRDVTPRNILLAGGSAKLGDLGIARATAAQPSTGTLTPVGATVGTLGYLAPELLAGEPATPASDVFGLGAVAHRALTGALPHSGTGLAEMVAAGARAVPSIAGRVPSLPPVVATAIDAALAVDPTGRPSAAGLAAAFAGSTPTTPHADTVTVVGGPALDRVPALPAPEPAPAEALPPGKPRRGRHPLPEAGPRYRGPGLWSGELLAIVVVAIIVLVIVLLVGGRPG